jgi:hypothetical protein
MARARVIAALVAAAALLAAAGSAHAAGPPTPWNGENPFNCVLQQAGLGGKGPDPTADPYCVEFDKRQQNVTQGGVVTFLRLEPERFAAAGDKCFYFQKDHWRGSVVQSDGSTKTYEWDGQYFFDRARGEGGVWVTNFNFNGRTYDPSTFPGMPPEYGRFFGPGTGGMVSHNEIPVEQRCVDKARQNPGIYRRPGGPGPRGCPTPKGGASSRHLGFVSLGATERRVRELLGPPGLVHRGFLHYCLLDGTRLLVGQVADRSGDLGEADDDPTVMLWSTSRAFRYAGVGPGTGAGTLRRRWPRRVLRLRMGITYLYSPSRNSPVVVGLRRGAVRNMTVYERRTIRTMPSLRLFLLRTSV